MRKISIFALLLLGLSSCERDLGTDNAASSAGDSLVMIAPRIARASSLSWSLYSRATMIGVALADSVADSLHTIWETKVPYSQGSVTIPAVDKNKHVTVLVAGYDASDNILWAGTTGDQLASELARVGVDAKSNIAVYPAPTEAHDASLVGSWSYDSLSASVDTIVHLQLWLYSDGTFAYNRRQSEYLSSLGGYVVMEGQYTDGIWSTNGKSLIIQPARALGCQVDETSLYSCDVPSLPGYTNIYSEIEHELVFDLDWSVTGGNLVTTDANGTTETWSPN